MKRIRRDGAVTVAPCDVRGRPHGEAVPGHATICDAAGTRRVRDLLKRKYRLIGRLSLLGSRLRRGEGGTVGIRVDAGRLTGRRRTSDDRPGTRTGAADRGGRPAAPDRNAC